MGLAGGNLCFAPQAEGYIRYVKQADPGAGNPLIWTNALDEALLLITSYVGATCSVVVANRYFRMRVLSSSGRTLWASKCSLVQAASSNQAYSWDWFNGNKNTFHWSSVFCGPCPRVWLLPDSQIIMELENMDAGDTLYSFVLQVRAHRL